MKEEVIIDKEKVAEGLKQIREYSQNDNIKVIRDTDALSIVESKQYGIFRIDKQAYIEMTISNNGKKEVYNVPLIEYQKSGNIGCLLDFYEKYINDFAAKYLNAGKAE